MPHFRQAAVRLVCRRLAKGWEEAKQVRNVRHAPRVGHTRKLCKSRYCYGVPGGESAEAKIDTTKILSLLITVMP